MKKLNYSLFETQDKYTQINEIDCFGSSKNYFLLYVQSELNILPFVSLVGKITHRNFTYFGDYQLSNIKTDTPQSLFYAPHELSSDSRLIIANRLSDMDNYLIFITEDKDRDTHLFEFLLQNKILACEDNSHLIPKKNDKSKTIKPHSIAERLWIFYQKMEEQTRIWEERKNACLLHLGENTSFRIPQISDYYMNILTEYE